ncbi:hypothetical protein KF707_11930 [Candidatus Obscuribacterales bacterium]|nr:hypothetical protein [Candidatus Obscuribacterales bacterium]MBX3136940.1 hypothetical protein [Candidatus Obscuribacterales bacterium]MBX3153549.1 hypothetical protein [Candidatus Obscuribacterales bacterium]
MSSRTPSCSILVPIVVASPRLIVVLTFIAIEARAVAFAAAPTFALPGTAAAIARAENDTLEQKGGTDQRYDCATKGDALRII